MNNDGIWFYVLVFIGIALMFTIPLIVDLLFYIGEKIQKRKEVEKINKHYSSYYKILSDYFYDRQNTISKVQRIKEEIDKTNQQQKYSLVNYDNKILELKKQCDEEEKKILQYNKEIKNMELPESLLKYVYYVNRRGEIVNKRYLWEPDVWLDMQDEETLENIKRLL